MYTISIRQSGKTVYKSINPLDQPKPYVKRLRSQSRNLSTYVISTVKKEIRLSLGEEA